MAVTCTLVMQEHNILRYLYTWDGAASSVFTITATGAVSPDLLTDSLAGPIKTCANAFANGLGPLAAGAKTQAQARAIWMAQDAGDAILGGVMTPRCCVQSTVRTATGSLLTSNSIEVDANVDGSGNPLLIVSYGGSAAGGTISAYIDVEPFGGPIGGNP